MTATFDSAHAEHAQRVPRVAGLISVLLGCMVLVGWVLDVQALQTLSSGLSYVSKPIAVKDLERVLEQWGRRP
jgi:hypothetical protein